MNLESYQKLLTVAEVLSDIDSDSFDAEEMIDFHDISDRLNSLINQSHHSLSRDSYRVKAAKAKLEALEADHCQPELSPVGKAEIGFINWLLPK